MHGGDGVSWRQTDLITMEPEQQPIGPDSGGTPHQAPGNAGEGTDAASRKWVRRLSLTAGAIAVLFAGAFFYYTRPHYAWLAFGPQQRLRVLMCDRALWITLTEFIDGEATSRVERFRDFWVCEGVTFADPDGATRYTITGISGTTQRPHEIFVKVKIDGPLAYEQYCDLVVDGRDAESARVAHFNGPLTVGVVTVNWKVPEGLALSRGSEPTSLRTFVGTMDPERGGWVVVSTQDRATACLFADGVRPEVEVAFPARSANQPAMLRRFTLEEVCCGCVFYGPVSVPDEAGDGNATLTFSFPAWAAARVAPSTLELPIVDPPAKSATDVVSQGGQ
jgi:hypothetical protein